MAPKAPPNGLTSIKGARKKPRGFKRTAVANDKKARVVAFYEKAHGMKKTMENFHPRLSSAQTKTIERQIHKWVANTKSIRKAVTSDRGKQQNIRSEGISTVLSSEDEDQIAHSVRDLRREGVPVSPFMLKCRAQEVASDAEIPP
ncbi:hypothetical protein PF011_g7725 [Phytophthora fragariae]|uniref:HTH CENPB-type domain-containing protein n=1 Tax=Phytophthora fragariae TaxID=53985 RepID=A0A6A3LBC0_9STRA|nr:hypothetical protein PF011_g7725 [Phytophthora fragariae]